MSNINIENLTKLINHLKKINAVNFDMRNWCTFSAGAKHESFYDKPAFSLIAYMEKGNGDCGTAACIAGHAALLMTAETDETCRNAKESTSRKAREWLGLTEQQADELFVPGCYIQGKLIGLPIPRNIPLDYTITVLENLKRTAEAGEPVIDWGDVSEFYDEIQRRTHKYGYGMTIGQTIAKYLADD